jgi:cytochrome c biogenesis protein
MNAPPSLDQPSTQSSHSVATATPERSRSVSKKTFPQQVWACLACFRSVQLAITLIAMLALATLAGVLLPQDGLVDVLEIKKTFGSNYRLMKAMGLFNVYSSYWFIAIEVLFFFNLLFGSFQWLKPAFLAATRVFFIKPASMSAAPNQLTFGLNASSAEALPVLTGLLKKKQYRVHLSPSQQGNEPILLYASKDSWSRLGPVVAHLGILLMLLASVYGAFYGFKAQKLAVPGEVFKLQDSEFFQTNVHQSVWLGRVPNWKIRVNDFKIEYYPVGTQSNEIQTANGVVKQYYADLSVLDAGLKEVKREVISVNHPLSVGSTVLYQASFKPTGKLFLNINHQPKTLIVNTNFMNRPINFTELDKDRVLLVFPFFVQQDPGVERNYIVVFLRDKKGFVGAKAGKMPPNLRLREGESGTLSGMTVQYLHPEMATGLQIKHGPEVWWMYTAYSIIIAGTLMCIFSQRQLWMAFVPGTEQHADQFMLMYQTKKAKVSFLKELNQLQTRLVESGMFKRLSSP